MSARRPARILALVLAASLAATGCERSARAPATQAQRSLPDLPEEPSPPFLNVQSRTAYTGDAACTACHAAATSAYRTHAMSRSFHRWTPGSRNETPAGRPLRHARSGFSYAVVDSGGRLFQVEFVDGPGGNRLHELRRPIDWVMGSGEVAETYFTEENGRLFQLPLTWYRQHGWDFSPGYDLDNPRFDRLLPDRCIACHSSYPGTLPFVEGKFAELPPGIGCERCHGPGARHVAERKKSAPTDTAYDATIVNPARLPLERRLDVCEQCHVHTAVAVLREGRNAFSYLPSQPLRDQWAFFNVTGSIDVVSHADRLRQSACFLATRSTPRPLECATCHNPHRPPPDSSARNQPCLGCHSAPALEAKFVRSAARADHSAGADCVRCHMPRVREKGIPHGSFTEHWIRVPTATSAQPVARRTTDRPITPYFERDRTGPDAAIYAGLGEIVYANLSGDSRVLGQAATALERALGVDTTPRGDARFLLGVAYQQLGRTDDAIRQLEQSVRIDSTRPDRLRALAQAYERARRPAAEVERLYRRALTLQPALAWIRIDYAGYLDAAGRTKDAEREYRTALKEQPGLATGWFSLAALLAGEQRLAESTDAFREAVHLDPTLAQALVTLLEVRTTSDAVTAVRALGSPLPTLPVRERSPLAVQLAAVGGGGRPGVRIFNAPTNGMAQVLEPDGTLVRALPTGEGSVVWDLLTDDGTAVRGGPYRLRVQGRDGSGRGGPPQTLYFGVVRVRED